MAHKRSVVSTLLKRAASHCSSSSLVRKEKAYVKDTLRYNGYPERFLFPLECHQSRKDTGDKDDPRSHVTILYIQGVSEAVLGINVQVHMKPLRKILSHPNDRIPDDDKSNIVYNTTFTLTFLSVPARLYTARL